jgi:WD40 repeat protein
MPSRRRLAIAVAAVAVASLAAGAAVDSGFGSTDPTPSVPAPALTRITDQQAVTALAFSPDGRLLAVAGDGGVLLRDATTGMQVHKLAGSESPPTVVRAAIHGPHEGITSLAFAPDGRIVAGGDSTGRIRLWNVADGSVVRELTAPPGAPAAVRWLAYAPDGRALAAADFGGPVALWDTAADRVRLLTAGGNGSRSRTATLAFTADGSRLVLISHSLAATVWDVTTGEPGTDPAFRTEGVETGAEGADTVAFDPRGRTVAVGEFGSLRLVDPATGRTRELAGHEGEVASLAFAPDGRTLVSVGGFYDGTARLWDVQTGRQRRLICECGYFSLVVFSPVGNAIAANDPRSPDIVYVWRL